jgi:hypothetical protein
VGGLIGLQRRVELRVDAAVPDQATLDLKGDAGLAFAQAGLKNSRQPGEDCWF